MSYAEEFPPLCVYETGKPPRGLHVSARELYQFAADYLWSEHGECPPYREACPQTPEQLRDIARAILDAVEGASHE